MPRPSRSALYLLPWILLALTSPGAAQDAQDSSASKPSRSVTGLVHGPLARPVAKARVHVALWPALDEFIAGAMTDDRGAFEVRGLPIEGTLWVFAKTEGFTRGQAVLRYRGGSRTASTYLRLWEASEVRGRVLDEDGNPVAGAEVLGDHQGFHAFRRPRGLTDERGHFALSAIPIGAYCIRVHARGFAMAEARGYTTTKDVMNIVLKRQAGMRIEAFIEGLPPGTERPAKTRVYPMRDGSSFTVTDELSNLVFDANATSGEQTLVLEGLLEADWTMTVPVLEGYVFEPRRVRFPKNKREHSVTFKASKIGTTILRGTLTNSAGDPLPGEELVCRTQRSQSMNGGIPGFATTDAKGAFELVAPLVSGESYSLHLRGSRYVLRQEKEEGHTGLHDERYKVRYEGTVDGSELNLEAVEGAFVSGKLCDEDGNPIPFQWMELQIKRDNWSPPWMNLAYATTHLDGTFRFSGVHGASDDLVRVHTSGKRGQGATEFTLGDGETKRDVLVEVKATGTVYGIITDVRGKPARGVPVSLGNFDAETGEQTNGSWLTVMTDRKGRYRFPFVSVAGHRVDVRPHRIGKRASSTVFSAQSREDVRIDVMWPEELPQGK